jgi:NTP pyrophosphatase (non-canonical NTP hydrolase)
VARAVSPVAEPRSASVEVEQTRTDVRVTSMQLHVLSRWIDAGNEHRDPEAVTWGRLSKVAEECGEVIAAFIGATGQNPRKGVTCTGHDVQEELLDVAITALGAVAHLNNNDGTDLLALLANKVQRVVVRATGIVDTASANGDPLLVGHPFWIAPTCRTAAEHDQMSHPYLRPNGCACRCHRTPASDMEHLTADHADEAEFLRCGACSPESDDAPTQSREGGERRSPFRAPRPNGEHAPHRTAGGLICGRDAFWWPCPDAPSPSSEADEFANGLRCKVCNVLSSAENYLCSCHLTCLDHDEDAPENSDGGEPRG